MQNFSVIKAGEIDSKGVWNIRYASSVKAVSLDQTVVPFEKHDTWFQKKYFDSSYNLCFVLKGVSQKVRGYCRFDLDDNGFLVSIAIGDGLQGKGLGHFLLSESLAQLPSSQKVLATIFKTNMGSLRLFEKNGFKIMNEDAEKVFLCKTV
jgi:ribosomal protein S18 acetylase RimI-like enzyme